MVSRVLLHVCLLAPALALALPQAPPQAPPRELMNIDNVSKKSHYNCHKLAWECTALQNWGYCVQGVRCTMFAVRCAAAGGADCGPDGAPHDARPAGARGQSEETRAAGAARALQIRIRSSGELECHNRQQQLYNVHSKLYMYNSFNTRMGRGTTLTNRRRVTGGV